MQNDLRSNPRFVATQGIPTTVVMDGQTVGGQIVNFSSTGFALVVAHEIGQVGHSTIEASFRAETIGADIRLTARLSNRCAQGGQLRLGCHITDMHGGEEAYFTFLTSLLGRQGLIRSMATKPKKVIAAGG